MSRLDMLQTMAIEQAKDSFVDSYFEKMTDEEKTVEGLGLLLSHLFRWSGEPIMKVAIAALTDANFHSEASAIEDMIPKYNVKE